MSDSTTNLLDEIHLYPMNTTIHQPQTSGNTVAFLFGAIFNILANTDYGSLVDYGLKAVIGGVIWLLFKIIGDYITSRFITNGKTRKPRKNAKQ